MVGRKFTVFPLFYFVFEGNFQVQDPRGAYVWRGLFWEFLRYIHKANITEYPWGVKFIFIPARKGIGAFHYSIEPVSATVGECPSSRILY